MGFRYVFVAIVASAITVFALQNNTPTSVRFLVWKLEAFALAAVILVSVALGVVLVGVPLLFERWRLRSRVRSLETRLTVAEALLDDGDNVSGSSAPSRVSGRGLHFAPRAGERQQ